MMQRNCFFIKGHGVGFKEKLQHIIHQYAKKKKDVVIRLVFFGNPSCHEEYQIHLALINDLVIQMFGDKPPVFNYVVQPPLGGSSLILEALELIPDTTMQFIYKRNKNTPYIAVETANSKMLFLSGVRAGSAMADIRSQSDEVFSKIHDILQTEEMPISSIVRQWNYIQDIVGVVNGRQNYQEFNDSRSVFYNKASFNAGFPAATGIGTLYSGVSIDLEALHPFDKSIKIIPLNNSLQVPAHAYSPCVLIGKDDEKTGQKATPKFERAKLVCGEQEGIIYISGTAAIRGEMSLENVGIEQQTRITLENIEHLISNKTLMTAGIENVARTSICSLRVYLKKEHFFESAKKIVDEKYAGLTSVYLKGDVCRDELLVEIEGFASLNIKNSADLLS